MSIVQTTPSKLSTEVQILLRRLRSIRESMVKIANPSAWDSLIDDCGYGVLRNETIRLDAELVAALSRDGLVIGGDGLLYSDDGAQS